MKELPDNVTDALFVVLGYLQEEGLEVEDYIGYTESDQKKPYLVSFGEEVICEVDIVMNTRSNGDYDGLGGFNFISKL